MKNINLSLSDKEYRNLIKLAFLGHWVINPEDSDTEYDELLNNILKNGLEQNAESQIEYDENLKGYFLTQEKQEQYLDLIDDYNNETFWDELVHQLAVRDVLQKYGEEKIQDMEMHDQLHLIEQEEIKYMKEFEKNGIKNLNIPF